MSLSQLIQAISIFPQMVNSIKKMSPEEKNNFVAELGLEGGEKDAALNIITCFQEGRALTPEEQVAAQALLDKALKMNNLDLGTLLSMNIGKS